MNTRLIAICFDIVTYFLGLGLFRILKESTVDYSGFNQPPPLIPARDYLIPAMVLWPLLAIIYIIALASRSWSVQLCPMGNLREDAFSVFVNSKAELNQIEDAVRTSVVGATDDRLPVEHRLPEEEEIYHSAFVVPHRIFGIIPSRLGESHIVITNRRVVVDNTRNNPFFRCDWAKFMETIAMDRAQHFVLVHAAFPKFGWADVSFTVFKLVGSALLTLLSFLMGTDWLAVPIVSPEWNTIVLIFQILALISKILQKDFGTAVYPHQISSLLRRHPDLPVARVPGIYDQVAIECALRNQGSVPSKPEFTSNPVAPSDFLLPGEQVAFYGEGRRKFLLVVPTHNYKAIVTTRRVILSTKAIWSRHELTVTLPLEVVSASFATTRSAFSWAMYSYFSALIAVLVVAGSFTKTFALFLVAGFLALVMLLAYVSRSASIELETSLGTELPPSYRYCVLNDKQLAAKCINSLRTMKTKQMPSPSISNISHEL